jgi:hypothetical protein
MVFLAQVNCGFLDSLYHSDNRNFLKILYSLIGFMYTVLSKQLKML